MSRRAKFYPDVPNHAYQRGHDYSMIFYSDVDRLVYTTIVSVKARRFGVTVFALSLMYDHHHSQASAPTFSNYNRFLAETTKAYDSDFKNWYGYDAVIMEDQHSHVPKWDDKKRRSNLAYIANNAVEKMLFKNVVDDRWNFLAYMNSDHPYSRSFHSRDTRDAMRKAIKVVDGMYEDNKYLGFRLLNRLMSKLFPEEREQLTDYIIHLYAPVDYSETIRLYGAYDSAVIAINANTGAEYDIKEKHIIHSHIPYREMERIARDMGFLDFSGPRIFRLNDEEKRDFVRRARNIAGASDYEVSKFMRISEEEVNFLQFGKSAND